VSLEKLWDRGGFVKKSGSKITVLDAKSRGEVDKVQSMVDVVHRAVLLWEKGERDEIAELLRETGFSESPALRQFSQSVAESLLNGNKEKQLLEGFLMGIDSYTGEKAKKDEEQTAIDQFGEG